MHSRMDACLVKYVGLRAAGSQMDNKKPAIGGFFYGERNSIQAC